MRQRRVKNDDFILNALRHVKPVEIVMHMSLTYYNGFAYWIAEYEAWYCLASDVQQKFRCVFGVNYCIFSITA